MQILTLSQYGDVHADAVTWALKQRGIPVRCWTVSDFPSRQRITVGISDRHGPEFNVRDLSPEVTPAESEINGLGDDSDIAVVWNRRLGRPTLHDHLDAGYVPFAREECQRFVRSIPFALAHRAKWINDPQAARLYESKLPQLVQAKRAGLRIPDTIVTNDPQMVSSFCERHGTIIYKAFLVPSWNFETGMGRALAVTFTTKLTRDTLDDHLESIEFAPGIFQPLIPKRSELRVVVMDGEILAARIDSQRAVETSIDWRAGPEIKLEKASLPESVSDSIRRFMRGCGLNFGCIDMIETPSGDQVFLEINQMGQFLWLDDGNDDLDTLQAFCSYLANAVGRPTPAAAFPDYRDYRASDRFRHFTATVDENLLHFQNNATHVLA